MKSKFSIISIIFILIVATIPISGSLNTIVNREKNSISSFYQNCSKISENGIILAQNLDENNMGYTVIRLWGSHYEMGYAQAELIGEYIVAAVNDIKNYAGSNYNEIKNYISETIWMPHDTEDEFDGIIDCLSLNYPSKNIDKLDLKVANTIGDWVYGYGCRIHTCWGRYVSDPLKTISSRRLDFASLVPMAHHHVLCARNPDDGSQQWINLAWPGFVTTITSVNQYGVLVSCHDFHTQETDFSQNVMPRMVAFRYVTTYANNTDLSTHLTDIYNEMKNYEIMTGGFLNYYAPEGYGGVIAFHPYPPSSSQTDFYNLRVPQQSWHHGEAMITTNAWTDGTYTPNDEDFGADIYYNDESPKTHESHWDLLNIGGTGNKNLHMMSVEYRDINDMTIWAEGKISSTKRTPCLEWGWTDLFYAPTVPEIIGPIKGENSSEYEYSFSSIDTNDYDIYYYIDWGDGSEFEEIGPLPSGDKAVLTHIWDESGTYSIRAKAKNTIEAESDWSYLEVSMPKNKLTNTPFIRFLENHPHLFPLLRQLLRL